ncbi:Extracellular exo-alpha-(1-_5)-L-arabinofuranosidase [Paenibacillus solanacearum]|uniref:Extracellular exo-alpha-(1->5)-L-arabinofuranosidase n=1 Tax=Paenibacillus solanacearum TaxID=2048548 RepID=A0A916JZE5_9BACL|nr:glycoside hydrolase family 43 protein [Paenibacillus solanacearum]CAG7609160.1 Extracellular exo-alpha-(1->5)-L-arabinofuranosidase [Paenibacillus solanacearum]
MSTQSGYYKNPLPIQKIGDPYILKASDGKYYCYPTSAIEQGFKAWSSDDLVHWQEEGFVYEKNEQSWGFRQFWAPEVVERDGKFYMYYTARWKEKDSLRIGVAVADRPAGPFIDVYDQPMFDFGYAAIDANILFDDSGKMYMYYSRDCSENIVNGRHESHLYGIELGDDMITVTGDAVCLTKPDQEWEMKSLDRGYLWNEGPFVLKRNGTYYLTYSANYFGDRHYSVGYAVSEKPLGPYSKYENNPVLTSQSDDISGPGHHSIIASPDGTELFMVYHTHTDPAQGGGNRQVCMDRMGFREDGTIYVEGPTLTEQAIPSNGRK